MSIRYRKVQNKNSTSENYGKWYPRAVVLNTVDTEQLAEEICHSTTMTFADIMGVLIELSNVMSNHLLNSDKVSLYRLGTFRVGIKGIASDKSEDVNASKIKGYRIVYAPNVKFTATGVNSKGNRTGFYTKPLLSGVKAELLTGASSTDTSSDGTTKTQG